MEMLTTERVQPEIRLPYVDFAVALYASSISFPLPDLDDQEVLAYALQGVEVLGGVEVVRRLHRTWVKLYESLQRRQSSMEDYARALRTIWPDQARLENCIGCDLGRFLP